MKVKQPVWMNCFAVAAAGREYECHRTPGYIRNNHEAGYFTFMNYLNNDFAGVETSFGNKLLNAVTGMTLIFLHIMEHPGSLYRIGLPPARANSASTGCKFLLSG